MRCGPALLCLLIASCNIDTWPPYDLDLVLSFNAPPTSDLPAEPHLDAHFIESTVVENLAGKSGQHAATIAALPGGDLLSAWYSYAGPEELDGAAIYFSRRAAGSNEWTAPALHIDRREADGNPVLYADGSRVWLFQAVVPFGWSTAHIEFQQSQDAGQTWSTPRSIAGPLGTNTRFPPIRLADGRLLLPAYDDLWQRCLFFVSDDGEDWRLLSTLATDWPGRPIQPSIVELASGRILGVMRNTAKGWLWAAASDDHGRSWSRPIDSGFPNPASPAALHRASNGNLILVYNDSNERRRPLTIALSTDEGRTWPYRRDVADGISTFSYPSLTESPDGNLQIVFTQDRARIRHVALNQSWILSPDSSP